LYTIDDISLLVTHQRINMLSYKHTLIYHINSTYQHINISTYSDMIVPTYQHIIIC